MSSSFDSEVTFGKPKKKTKRPALKNGSLAANSLTLNDDSTLDADSEHDTLQLNPSASSSAFKSRMEPSLSFDDGDDNESSFKLKKTSKTMKKKKPSIFDDDSPSTSKPSETQDGDPYSAESLKRLRDENAVQFKLVPLTKSEQRTLEEDDALMQYMGATEMIDAPKPSETIVIGDEEEADDGEIFRSKQVEAARALRAKLKRGDQTIVGETTRDALDAPQARSTSFMDVVTVDDDEDEHAGPVSDDEEEERKALGVDYNGRHYFSDAVTKKKQGDVEALKSQTSNVQQDTDAFFNQPEESDLEWELELIRRSGVKRSHQSIGNAHLSAKAKSEALARVEIQTIPDRAIEPLSEDDIVKRIEKDLAQMKSVASLHENRLATIESSREEHAAVVSKSDAAYSQATTDLQYFEDFKLYMVDLMDCIESKLPLIEEVEEKMFQTRLARVRKTQARIKSALAEEREAVRTRPGQQSDEAGAWKSWRRAKKLARDSAVQSARNATFSYGTPYLELEEGFSSDEETAPEFEALYESALVEVREAAISVFDDALPEFCDLGAILHRIASFRSRYNVSYAQAHISSQLPPLLTPLVRLELVSWNPLSASSNVLQWPWFDCFDSFVHDTTVNSTFSSHSDPQKPTSSEKPASEADANLLASITADVLVPKIKDAIKFFWRATSTTDTATIQTLLHQLRAVVPPKPLSEILVSVNLGLKHAIASFELPSGPTPNSEYAQVAFARALKLLTISTAWRPFFSPDATRIMICELLVNERLVPYVISMKKNTLECWRLLRLIVAALGPYLQATPADYLPTLLATLKPLDSFIASLQQESMGHYESFEISDSVASRVGQVEDIEVIEKGQDLVVSSFFCIKDI